MSRWTDPTSNPMTVAANVTYNSDGNIIVVGTSTYDQIAIVYNSPPGSLSTTIQLTQLTTSTKQVSNIQTTKVGGHPTTENWTNNDGVWSYPIKGSFIGAAHHTVDFTVTWSDGTRHDPEIIINPTNN